MRDKPFTAWVVRDYEAATTCGGLPTARKCRAAAWSPANRRSSRREEGTIRLVRRRLLIVDDNRDFRRLARRLLGAEGFEVVAAARSASEALIAAGTFAPDVVLLDVNLPDASGFDVAARLVRELPSVAVVLTSTRSASEFEELAVASGARGFVPKDDLSAAELDRLLG